MHDGIEGIYGVTEADEQEIGLCPCGKGYNGHDSQPLCRKGALLERVSDGRSLYPPHHDIPSHTCPEWEAKND